MNTDIIESIRQIIKNRHAGKEVLQMPSKQTEVTKSDLFGQMKAMHPGLTEKDMDGIYKQLQSSGDIKLITNDIVEFDKKFYEG